MCPRIWSIRWLNTTRTQMMVLKLWINKILPKSYATANLRWSNAHKPSCKTFTTIAKLTMTQCLRVDSSTLWRLFIAESLTLRTNTTTRSCRSCQGKHIYSREELFMISIILCVLLKVLSGSPIASDSSLCFSTLASGMNKPFRVWGLIISGAAPLDVSRCSSRIA